MLLDKNFREARRIFEETRTVNLTIDALRDREQSLSDEYPDDLKLRIHRGVSWLAKAENQVDDEDAAFMFYWVAFNALYGFQVRHVSEIDGERSAFQGFFQKISLLDSERIIYDELWRRFPDSVRVLIRNKYVFQPFWKFHHEIPGNDDWEDKFEKAIEKGYRALENGDTVQILSIIFDRLYVLRNQVFHGAATYQSSVNRAQIRDATKILAFLLPLFVELMMDNPSVSWGTPGYAVVD